jgi:DNA-binding LytR/AlgR family response regulator
MKVLLIEDESHAVKRLSALLKEIDPDLDIVGSLDSIASSVKWLEENGCPDLLFLDIHLADGNSFLIFEQTKITCPIIFATAYDEFAIQAFKVNSIDYLLKPIEKSDLERSLEKLKAFSSSFQHKEETIFEVIKTLKEGKREYKQRFLVKIADRLLPIHVDQTHYFLAEDKLVFLQTGEKKYPIDFTLDQLEEVLDPKTFFRINRKLLGHVQCIQKIFYHLNGKLKVDISPLTKEEVFVSRERAAEFKNWLGA